MIAGFGLVMFMLQFTLLFSGIYAGTSAGLASLLLQIQVFVTILLAVVFLAEQASLWQIVGAVISFSGIGLVAANFGGDISIFGLLLILLASIAWAIGNLISKKLGKINMFALIVWGSFMAWPPLFMLSWILENDLWSLQSIVDISWPAIGAIAYMVYPATLLGYVAWGWLLSRYPAATIAPFTLLVPVFGMTASSLVLGEPMTLWKIYAAILVFSGLCINLFGPRLMVIDRVA